MEIFMLEKTVSTLFIHIHTLELLFKWHEYILGFWWVYVVSRALLLSYALIRLVLLMYNHHIEIDIQNSHKNKKIENNKQATMSREPL